MNQRPPTGPYCPSPGPSAVVQLRHGAGGVEAQSLIEGLFRSAFDAAAQKLDADASEINPDSALLVDGLRHDSALLELGTNRVAFTTDGYVVTPLFFDGGSIGKLAVCGTCNDLAMLGAEPKWLSAAFVLEEGLALETLARVIAELTQSAVAAKVRIVAGDTKVVERGKGDGVYITTTGLGLMRAPSIWSPKAIQEGDAIVVSGDLGRHGSAVLCAREGLGAKGLPPSDCANLWPAVASLIDARAEIHCLRDLTRGGLGAALLELSQAAGVLMEIDETALPVCAQVRDFCELLGLDPIYVACEGRFVAVVAPSSVDETLAALSDCSLGEPKLVGRVRNRQARGAVHSRSAYGTLRPIDVGGAEQLPRIC